MNESTTEVLKRFVLQFCPRKANVTPPCAFTCGKFGKAFCGAHSPSFPDPHAAFVLLSQQLSRGKIERSKWFKIS